MFSILVKTICPILAPFSECDLVGHVLGGVSSQVCVVFLCRASSFPVSFLPMNFLFRTELEYIAFLIDGLDYFHLLPLLLEWLFVRCSVVLRETLLKWELFIVLEVHNDFDLISLDKNFILKKICYVRNWDQLEVLKWLPDLVTQERRSWRSPG